MNITEVARRRRSLYQLTLTGGELTEVQVDVKTFDESPYSAGAEITPEALDTLLTQSRLNRARDRALYLLGLRDYASEELAKKLLTEASPEEAAAVVARLAELGLVDDARYAANAARNMSQYRQYPRRRVEQELRRRGVDGETARTAAQEIESEDWKLALALIEKKYYNKMDTPDDRRRVAAALGRRGFPYGAVRRAMAAFSADRETDSEEFEDEWP